MKLKKRSSSHTFLKGVGVGTLCVVVLIFVAQYLVRDTARKNNTAYVFDVNINDDNYIKNDINNLTGSSNNMKYERNINVESKATSINYPKQSNTPIPISMIPKSIPSLVVVGFPKCGTSSLKHNLEKFDDLQFFGGERHYWRECWPADSNGNTWQADEWKLWINTFIHDNGNLSSIADYCVRKDDSMNPKEGKIKCTMNDYINGYHTERRMKQSVNKQHCIHLTSLSNSLDDNNVKYNYNYNNNSYSFDKSWPYCWFYEKGSNVRMAFMIAPIFANKLGQTRTLMIVREPLKQLVSFVQLDIDTLTRHSRNPRNSRNSKNSGSDYLGRYLWNFYQENEAFGYIQEQSALLLDKLIYLQSIENNNNNNDNKLLLKSDYLINSNATKEFLQIYLYHATVRSDIYIDDKFSLETRHGKAFTMSMYFVSLIFYLYAYDESFGYKNWNQFRVIQFEWLYGKDKISGESNMFNAICTIKCWLQTNKEIINNPFKNCPIIFGNDRNYYNKKKKSLNQRSKTKRNSITHSTLTNQYKEKFEQFYHPITKLFLLLLNHRKEILLGEWKPWEQENNF